MRCLVWPSLTWWAGGIRTSRDPPQRIPLVGGRSRRWGSQLWSGLSPSAPVGGPPPRGGVVGPGPPPVAGLLVGVF